MNILKEFLLNEKCSYLDNKEQSLEYKVIEGCSLEDNQNMVQRGYRRFGKLFFRPICGDCHECQSIKVDVNNFTFSKSMRRVLKKATNLKIYIRGISISQEHLDLFEKYHQYMSDKRGWDYHRVTPQSYHTSFVDGHNEFAHEVLYYDDEKLIGVDLIDIFEDGISSIYFYYDPDYSQYSLGKLSLLYQIKYAQSTNKGWIYLGYYVQDCPSLSYKSIYKPYLTLQGRPKDDEEFIWL